MSVVLTSILTSAADLQEMMAKSGCANRAELHERLAVAQLLTRVSFGFSLGVGVLKIFSSPTYP